MSTITFIPTCGGNSEMLYAKPCVFEFTEDYLSTRCVFAYSHKTDDEMMPSKEVSLDEQSFYLKQFIHCVEWAYSSEGDVWFFQIWHNGENSFWNVESKEKAIEIVDAIRNWLINKEN